MASSPIAVKLGRLRALADRPEEQVALAARLLETERNAELVLAALAVLAEAVEPAHRPILLAAYAHYAANPARRDPGAAIRAALLRALGPVALATDIALLEAAATTYEFLLGEAAGDLRAAALLALATIDPPLAGYHAVRLLTDPHTSLMSGQPAVTAARLLAAQGQTLPLYALAANPSAEVVGEVVAECLRGLTPLPASLLPALVARYRASQDEIVVLGLFDLLLAHAARADYLDFLLDFLRDTTLENIFRYLVTTLVASRETALLDHLEALACGETNPRRREILQAALALRPEPARRRGGSRERPRPATQG